MRMYENDESMSCGGECEDFFPSFFRECSNNQVNNNKYKLFATWGVGMAL